MWVRTTDSMPEVHKLVLLVLQQPRYGDVAEQPQVLRVGKWNGTRWCGAFDSPYLYPVTHWQALPGLPVAESYDGALLLGEAQNIPEFEQPRPLEFGWGGAP